MLQESSGQLDSPNSPNSDASSLSRPLVIVDRISKYFNHRPVVDQVSFGVGVGEVVGVMGPNGAGKTTTMRMIAGFFRPDRGRIFLDRYDMSRQSFRAKLRLGYLPEGAPLWPDMRVIDFMGFAARIRGFDRVVARRAIDEAIMRADLGDVCYHPIATLSKGYRRRVGLAQAIFHDPPILVLDEPTDGLDPNQKKHIRALIRSLSRTKAIIISTHILEEVEPLCTRILIMNQGKILVDESPADFAARSDYRGAVSIRLSLRQLKRMTEKTAQLSIVRDVKVTVKKDEALMTFFSKKEGVKKEGAKKESVKKEGEGEQLAGRIRRIARQENITLRGLSVEAGRLDDVFYKMTGK